jgi:hypothetical protein
MFGKMSVLVGKDIKTFFKNIRTFSKNIKTFLKGCQYLFEKLTGLFFNPHLTTQAKLWRRSQPCLEWGCTL